jgi:hypothetical protein
VFARFCAGCGAPLLPSGRFCPSCGAPTSPLPGSAATGAPAARWDERTPERARVETDALKRVQAGTVLEVLGAGATVLAGYYYFFSPLVFNPGGPALQGIQPVGPTGTWVAALYALLLVACVAFVFVVAGLLWFRSAFASLSRFEPRFQAPSRLIALELLGASLFLGTMLASVVPAIVNPNCTAFAPVPQCLPSPLPALFVLVLFVALGTSIAGFAGLVLGVWELGDYYRLPMFHAGAILLLIPGLNLIGGGFSIIAAQDARLRIQGYRGSPFW